MVVCSPDYVDGYHYIQWIADYFGDCIYTPRDIASFSIGLFSIAIWIPAQFPQIFMNFKLGRVEAIHPLFLINWAVGDSTNLAGCILTKQLATQLYTAIYYCAVDVLMLTQYAYYQCCRPKCCPKWEERARAAMGFVLPFLVRISVNYSSPVSLLLLRPLAKRVRCRSRLILL